LLREEVFTKKRKKISFSLCGKFGGNCGESKKQKRGSANSCGGVLSALFAGTLKERVLTKRQGGGRKAEFSRGGKKEGRSPLVEKGENKRLYL